MPRIPRFRKRSSDRSGFDHKDLELVKEGLLRVHPDEFDQPPPSRRSLGGEGEVSGQGRAGSEYVIANASVPSLTLHIITAAGGITPSFTEPWMQVAGSTAVVTVSATPQILPGQERQVLTLECVSNALVLQDGNGLRLHAGHPFTMTSGSILSLYYTSGATLWTETSRTP